jgi:hypothetical protein
VKAGRLQKFRHADNPGVLQVGGGGTRHSSVSSGGFDMNSMPAESTKQFMRRWRFLAYALALGLPMLAILATIAMVFLGDVSEADRRIVLERNLGPISFIPLLVLFFSWPYLVLDLIVSFKIRRRPEDLDSLRRPAMGALVGLTIPYLIGYSFWPFEMSSVALDTGQGIGLMLPMLGWLGGPVAAMFGWKRGRRLSVEP